MSRLFICSLFLGLVACDWNSSAPNSHERQLSTPTDSLELISDIAPPPGYHEMVQEKNSFGEWLRAVALKKDRLVYLYNGLPKRNQRAQFAVLDISVGKKDLQQCADAVMRLRAEYLFSQNKYSDIEFRDNANHSYKWQGGSDRTAFAKYLETVFGMCGSASLEKQLRPLAVFRDIQPGDVLIKGGFPGHAMIVVDVTINEKGEKMYMLAQSYMPAQDIHIVKNPSDNVISPWYEVTGEKEIVTPEWTFSPDQLRRW